MQTFTSILAAIFLAALGYVLLKHGLHIDSTEDKMKKATAPEPPRRYGKVYAVILGSFCLAAVIYFVVRIF